MRTYQFQFKKSILLLFVGLFASLFILSCKDKKEEKSEPGIAAPDATSSCFILAPTRIRNAWVTTGLTTRSGGTGDMPIKYLKFLSNYDAISQTVVAVSVQAYDVNDNAIGGTVSLAAGTGCNVTLAKVVAGEVIVDLTGFPIFNADGTSLLANFNNVIATPTVYKAEGISYLNYTIEYVIDGENTAVANVLPCPPCRYCRPIPDDCPIVGADKKKDSI